MKWKASLRNREGPHGGREDYIWRPQQYEVSVVDNLGICHLVYLAWDIFVGKKRKKRPDFEGAWTVT